MTHAGFIDGAFVSGRGEALVVENPSTEDVVDQLDGLSVDQVRDAIASARRAFDSGVWSGKSARQRAEVLHRYVEELGKRAGGVVDLIVSEAGCPRASQSMAAQVHLPLRQGPQIIDFFLTLPDLEENPLPMAERVSPLGGTLQSLRRYTPIGVVAAIAAYNFPFLTALWKVIPALIAGNTVVLRPSPLTPLSALVFAEAAQAAGLPPGVLNVVLESGLEGGRLLTTDPQVDMVAFTGSSSVGVQVMQQAASTMKRLQLELGGKSAQIFLPDSLERVAAVAAGVVSSHAGQGCALGTRIFVPQGEKAAVLGRAKAAFEAIRIGQTEDPSTQLGPVISAAQRARCEHFTKLALEAGGRVVTGGARPPGLERGYFFQPTLLDAPDNDNPAAQEEIFGPVVCVIGYRDLDHAVEMANASRYGLSGYVYGLDRKTALDVGLRIRSGTVNVNAGMMSAYASSGGIKMSGVQRERGVEGARLYQQLSVLNLGG